MFNSILALRSTPKHVVRCMWLVLWTCISLGTATGQAIVIPFTYDPISQPLLLVSVSINNSRSALFVLDTGSYWPASVTEDFAKKIGLPLDQRVTHKGSNNTEVTLVPVRSITIGKGGERTMLKLPEDEVVLLSNSLVESISTAYGIEVVGIIGVNAFERLHSPVLIDFATNTLTVGAPKPNTDDAARTAKIPLVKKQWHYGVSLQAGSGKAVELLLDTGSAFVLFKSGITGLPIKAKYEGTTEHVLLSEAKAGTLREEDVPAGIDKSLDATLSWDGLLGLSFLSRFRVWLDFAGQEMVLERLPDGQRRRLPGAGEAWLNRRANDYVVRFVVPDGPLYKAGVREGDRVLEVDGVELSKLTPLVADAVLRGLAGTEAKLLIERGGEKKTVSFTRRSLYDMPSVTTTSARPPASPGLTIEFTEKGFIIAGVAPGSPGEQAGLKVGDEVVEFNGLRFMSVTAEQILRLPEILRSLTVEGQNKMIIRRDGRLIEISIHL